MSCSTQLVDEPGPTSVLNVKISISTQCTQYVTLNLIQCLPCLKYRPTKRVKNFLIIKTESYSYTIFLKKQPPHCAENAVLPPKFLHINVSGLKGLHFIQDAADWILCRLKPIIIQDSSNGLCSPKISVDAITSKCALDRYLHLGTIAKNFSESVKQCRLGFDRSVFPALTIRHPKLKTVVCFSSGRLVFFGQSTLSQQKKLLSLLLENVDE